MNQENVERSVKAHKYYHDKLAAIAAQCRSIVEELNIDIPGSLAFETGTIILFMLMAEKTSPKVLSRWLDIPLADVLLIRANLKASEIYKDGKIHTEYDVDDPDFIVEFILFCACGSGHIVRSKSIDQN